MKPNNITRLLDAQHIAYQAYELPAEKLGAFETAQILGVPPERVYKTIVVLRSGKGKPLLAIVPGDSEVDLKKLARAVNEKKLTLPTERQAEQLTGLQAGGISPLALIKRGFQMILDQTAQSQNEIHISGGQRGVNIRLSVSALITVTGAQVADISTRKAINP